MSGPRLSALFFMYAGILLALVLTAAPYDSHAESAPGAGLQGVLPGFADGNDGVAYDNVVVVAKSGGDFASIQAALDSITDAAADNPYLVWVAAEVYEEQVTLEPYVTLQGAGEGATIVRWNGGSQFPSAGPGSATLVGADNATVQHLTVASVATGTGNSHAIAIWNYNASPTLVHVTATASGNGFLNFGMYNDNASPVMTNVTAIATGGGANYGVVNSRSSPTMTNVTATVSGGNGSSNHGVVNSRSSPVMSNVTATACGDSNVGVYNTYHSSPAMSNVTATASGSNSNTGVYNHSSSPEMTNVTATASGGSYNDGVSNYSSSPVIRDSRLAGDIYSVYVHDDSGTVYVANSQLVGRISSGITCNDNYDENLDPVTCP